MSGGPAAPTDLRNDVEKAAGASDAQLRIRQNSELQNLFSQANTFFNPGGSGRGLTDLQPSLDIQQPGVQDLENAAGGFRQAGQGFQGAAEGFQGAATRADAITGQAGESLGFLTSGDVLRPESNPALQRYIELSNQQLGRGFQQNVIPAITSGTAAVGGIGSSRQGVAEGIASQGLIDAQQRNTAGLTTQGYGQGLQAFTQGLELAPGLAQAQGVGSGFRGVGASFLQDAAGADALAGQTQFDAGTAQFGIDNAPRNQELQALRDYEALINKRPLGTAQGPIFQQPQAQGNKVATALGAGISAYAALKGVPGQQPIAGAAVLAGLL